MKIAYSGVLFCSLLNGLYEREAGGPLPYSLCISSPFLPVVVNVVGKMRQDGVVAGPLHSSPEGVSLE